MFVQVPLENHWVLVPQSVTAVAGAGRFSPSWRMALQSLHISVATILIAFTLVRVVHVIKSRTYRPGWGWIRIASLLLQIIITLICVPDIVLGFQNGTANVDWLNVGVRAALTIAALINCLSIGKGLGSDSRGLYHIIQCMVCVALQSLHPQSAPSFDWILQVLFAAAFLLDIFYSSNLAARQFWASTDSRNALEILSYSWMDSIVKMGGSATLDQLPDTHLLSDLSEYKAAFTASHVKETGVTDIFWGFLGSMHRSELVCAAICRLVDDCSKLSLPWLLRYLLLSPSLNIATGLFCCRVIGALCGNYAEFCLRRIGVRYRAMLAAALYDKTLRIGDLGQTTSMDVTTLSEVDAQRLSGSTPLFNNIWSLPLQVALAIVGVLILLSWEGAVAITFTIVLLGPFLGWVNKRMALWVNENMTEKDGRTRLTREILRCIKSIKMHALEFAFTRKLAERRDAEVQAIANLSVVQAAMVCVMQTAPCLLTFVSFALKLWRGQRLQPDLVFASIMLFTMLNSSLTQLSGLAMNFRILKASESRIKAYLQLPEGNLEIAGERDIKKTLNGYAVELKDIQLAWPGQKPLLTGNKAFFQPGTLNVVTGPVGSGKSSLLLGIIRQLEADNVVVAFSAQDAFLSDGNIRDNILFGKSFDPRLYDRVVDACELKSDFARLTDGDRTSVSGSVALSGGQKSRICLARAAYSMADVYVLDDPLAAVDAKVQRKIMAKVFSKSGLMGKTTRIVASQTPELLQSADQLLSIAERALESRIGNTTGVLSSDADDHVVDGSEFLVQTAERESETRQSLDRATQAESINLRIFSPEPVIASASTVPMNTDPRPRSRSPFLSYVSYARKGGWLLSFMLLFFARGVSVIATYVLKLFSTESLVYQLRRDILIYGLLSTCQGLFFFLFVYVTYTRCILPACKRVHDLLAFSIVSQEMRFFETESIGGILNLFTNDLARIDNSLSGSMLSLIAQYANLLLACCVMLGSIPSSLAFLAPLALVCYKLQQLYVKSLRQLRHLDVASRAPLLSYLQEAESGRVVIGIFHYAQKRALTVRSVLGDNIKALFPLVCVDVWLGLRLEILSVTLQVLAIDALIAASVDLTTIGFVMTYVFQVTVTLSTIARFTATFEMDTVSLSRVHDSIYNSTTHQHGEPAYRDDPVDIEDATAQPSTQGYDGNSRWPRRGKIEFRSVSARYAPNLPPSLHSVSFSIMPGEKVAVVGRTGAGKSSLMLLLLGMMERICGDLLVDDLDVSRVDPSILRQSFALVPQEPVIFSASVRQNLDPFGIHTDEEIKWVLQESGVYRSFCEHPFQDSLQSGQILDSQLDAQGGISGGQIQLLGLARALLSPSKILILDEATSGVDASTERRMHEVLRNNFRDATCIAIMHRLDLSVEYDKVLVLDEGKVVEFDTPAALVAHPGSLYASMLQAARLIQVKKTERS